MADDDHEFSVGELLASPVRAIQEAQMAAEIEFLQFVQQFGFEPFEKQVGRRKVRGQRLRTIEFEMRKSMPDPVSPGSSVERSATVTAPLLSVVNLPTVSIDEATIELSLDIEAETDSRTKAADTGRPLPGRRPVILKGVVGKRLVNSSLRKKGRLDVSMKLVASRDNDGLDRLMRLLDDGLAATIDEEEK